jgi:peptidylprolyl isomerase/FKBP-type peptidyl-prolyl cis-trans isomerase FkpA
MKKNTIVFLVIILLITISGVLYYFMPKNNNSAALDQSKQASGIFEIQGMKVEILKQANGAEAKIGDKVTVNYVGTLPDGTKFDSSIDRNTPFEFTLGENKVIRGWELGVLGMKVGEERMLTIPPELGYGPQGFPPIIPENATLIFKIDLLGIN